VKVFNLAADDLELSGTCHVVFGRRVDISAVFGESGSNDARWSGRALGVGPAVDGRTHKVMILVDVDEQYRTAAQESSCRTFESSSGGSERGAQGT